MHFENHHCRSCNSTQHLETVLSLGRQPLANAFHNAGDSISGIKHPLNLAICPECHLLQLVETVMPHQLFDTYMYFTSCSAPMVEHARKAAERYQEEFLLESKHRIVEIASNDGYFLKHFKDCGATIQGIDPAANVAAKAIADGIPTDVTYFNYSYAANEKASNRGADLILANNVLAHVPDINDFVSGINVLLNPYGRAILEFPSAVDMISRCEFDTIYHEHVFYFTLTSLIPLFERHSLMIYDVEHLEIHGGAMRIFVCHKGNQEQRPSVELALQSEKSLGVDTPFFYNAFALNVQSIRNNLQKLLKEIHDSGHIIAAYGASAKGSTLLNYCSIEQSLIECIADCTPAKQGKLAPGSEIPVVSTEEWRHHHYDYTLLLIWNFKDYVLQQEHDYYTKNGGHFMTAIPNVGLIAG